MFRRIRIMVIVLIFLLTSCAQNVPSMPSDKKHDELQDTMHNQFQAMIKGDIETLERIYSDDYALISRKGAILEKTGWIQMLASGQINYLSIGDRSEIKINLCGNVAVVRGLIGSTVYELDGERLESGPRRFTAVWVYEKNQWRQVTRQHTTIKLEMEEPLRKELT